MHIVDQLRVDLIVSGKNGALIFDRLSSDGTLEKLLSVSDLPAARRLKSGQTVFLVFTPLDRYGHTDDEQTFSEDHVIERVTPVICDRDLRERKHDCWYDANHTGLLKLKVKLRWAVDFDA